MNSDQSWRCCFICVQLCLAAAFLAPVAGCGKPNQANIELRKQLQEMETQVGDLERNRDADAATIRSLQQQLGTLPTLPKHRLDELFTVHGLSLGRLTGGADLDTARPGDEGIKVYAVPTDGAGDELKAAGSFTVELFDLNRQADNLVGRWVFGIEEARTNWFGSALLYEYVLTCPWQERPPASSDLTLKVTFRDALTQREFETQQRITIKPPPQPPHAE